MRYFLLSILFFVSGCAIMGEPGLKVRVVRIDNTWLENGQADAKLGGLGCTFLNVVERSQYILVESDSMANLKNRTASVGANILLAADHKYYGIRPPTEGRAYKCPTQKLGEITPGLFSK